MTATIHPLTAADEAEWRDLWGQYLVFYGSTLPEDVTTSTFARLVEDEALHGALARDESGRAVGMVNWLSHPATWSRGEYCYLEDLFVAPDVRGGGIGRALIAHVRVWADGRGCAKVYWLTQEGNATARVLYDRVGRLTGYVHYQIDLPGAG